MQTYVGQLLLVGFNFAPVGWAFCNGQLLAINQYDMLYNLIGTTYGGDGQNTFGVPDLRGHTPIGIGQLAGGSNYQLGQGGGVENVAIFDATYPTHTHNVDGISAAANTANPSATTLAGGRTIYVSNTAASVALNPAMVGMSNGISAAHPNLQPFQVLNWIISLYGIYPTP